ncbi:MAG: PDZ domain-containing protein [Fimbriimonadales bacterium]|nr:PDZ domain-containing protein [Fimbriimonadales bacterium]
MRRLIGIFAAVLAAGFAFGQPISAEQKAEVLKAVEEFVTTRAFVPGMDFSKWPSFIEKQQAAVDEATEIPAFTNAINRALREFGASHIRLVTPRAAIQRTQTSTIGVGATVRKEDEGLVVRAVSDNGPAKEAGLQIGDVIIEVDGKPVEEDTTLDGDEGTKVELKIKRADGRIEVVQVERRRFSTVRPETLTWIDDETAILRVFTFNVGYGRENLEKLFAEAAKAKRLIIDLRSNGGGAVNNLNHFLSHLLPNNTVIGTFVSRQVADRYARETGKDPSDVFAIAEWSNQKMRTREQKTEAFKGQIAVLVNRGSASASEIAAAALKEQGNAVIVGTRTAGAVLASVFGRLPHGFQLQYPVNDYVTAKGVRLERNPVVPDAEVTQSGNPDPAVAKAIELMKAKSLVPDWLKAA